ncbi:MAG: PAS domain-containing protein [Phycisphaerae bacterium]|nr:PAS domain-containing protein [Phycisphaerae bacterium]
MHEADVYAARIKDLEAQLKERDALIATLQAQPLEASYDPQDQALPPRIRRFTELRASCASDLSLTHSGLAAQILDALPVQVYVKTADRRYAYLNAAALRRMDYPKIDPHGQSSDDVILEDADLRNTVRDEDLRSLKSMGPLRAIEHWTDNTGRYRTNVTTRFRICDPNGNVLGTVSIASDEEFRASTRTTEAIVELLVHDWVSGLLEALHDKLQNLLYWKSQCESYSSEVRAEAANLLELARAGDPDPSRIDSGMTGEVFNGWVGHTFIPIHFMEGYLRFLRWYLGDPTFMQSGSRGSMMQLSFRFACLEYMNRMFAFLRGAGNGPLPVSSQWSINYDSVPDDLQLEGDVHLLRMLIMEMVRNHDKYGRPISGEPLAVRAERRNGAVEIAFFSAGEPLDGDSTELERLWKRGERKQHDPDPRRQRPGAGFGLFFCDRIAKMHGCAREIRPSRGGDFKGNVFVFTFPKG